MSRHTKAGRRASFQAYLTDHATSRQRRAMLQRFREMGATAVRLHGVGKYLVGTGVTGAWVLPCGAVAP